MQIIKVGISYQTAPVEMREKLSFTDYASAQAMRSLNDEQNILENVIFSTCNRTEIYAVTEDATSGIPDAKQFLTDWFGVDFREYEPFFTASTGHGATRHLFSLATGLDSMVIGEKEILGQVKNAYEHAQSAGGTGKILNELFKRVITFAKRAHEETPIGQQAVSISYVGVELAKKIFDNLEDQHVVIIGAGEMSELSLKNLQGAGVSRITVMNRTWDRAKFLAERFNAKAMPYDRLATALQDADIVITSTASSQAILTKESAEEIVKKRKGAPLFLIDIAVPRDIDKQVEDIDNVFLYDVDDLKNVANENHAAREKTARELKNHITPELDDFDGWIAMQDVVPLIRALQKRSNDIQEKTLASIQRKMPNLTDREKKVLQKHTKSIANQLLSEPIKKAKMMRNSDDALAVFRDIFGLDSADKEENPEQR